MPDSVAVTATVNADGHFRMALPPGPYAVYEAEEPPQVPLCDGRIPTKVTVRAGKVANVTLTLCNAGD